MSMLTRAKPMQKIGVTLLEAEAHLNLLGEGKPVNVFNGLGYVANHGENHDGEGSRGENPSRA